MFFVDALPPPGPFELGGEEGRHAAGVRRLRTGEHLVLSDGAGAWAAGTVRSAGTRSLVVDLGPATVDPPSRVRVLLVQALPKGERADLAVELATEAGVDEIVPWQSARCVARWDGDADKAARGREKWQRTAREAAKQSRRHRIPQVHPLAGADEVTRLIAGADSGLILHGAGAIPLTDIDLPRNGTIVLIVGPEGGLTGAEIELFERAGARAVRLGPEVLRTSTAAAVALGALGVLTGRWSATPS